MSFVSGVGSLLDLRGSRASMLRSPEEDALFLGQDWNAVISDIEDAIQEAVEVHTKLSDSNPDKI